MIKYFKYIIILSAFIFLYGSRKYFTSKQLTPPYYELAAKSVNNLIENSNSIFDQSEYISTQVTKFMGQWGLKGVSIAVIKDEKLVFAQGFGVANDQQTQVKPGNLFRLASVSKLITATAIMKLIEDQKLSLDDNVFGPDGILNDSIFDKVTDKRLYKITVRNLLAHSGGWTLSYGDPAFNALSVAQKVGDNPPATINSFYKFIASRKLAYEPGTSYSYSNMGYMFLGEVISKASGEPYETYIQNKILIPNGILDMHIGRNSQKDHFDNEVQYFEQEESELIPEYNGSGKLVAKSDGGNPVNLLGAAGGWVSSSVELAKFITLVDGQRSVTDIISVKSISEMTVDTKTKGPLGWLKINQQGEWVRTGSMAGTSAMVKRQKNGISWVFVSNTSSWKGTKLATDIEQLMSKITTNVKNWPNQDLFNYYPIDSLPIAEQ